MSTEIYLDNNATTHLSSYVKAAIGRAMEEDYGNPSSEHRSGEKSRKAIVKARDAVANLLRTSAEHIVFGSGATELSYWAIRNMMGTARHAKLVTTAVEHSCVLSTAASLQSEGIELTVLPVNCDGLIDLDGLREELRSGVGAVSIQWVNNETGVVQPVHEIAHLCRDADVPFHCDAAQACGKIPIDLSAIKIPYLTVSAHKMHGPTGIGALYAEDMRSLTPLFYGGFQENGYRPGTENLLGIIGFGAAAAERHDSFEKSVKCVSEMRDRFENQLLNQLLNVEVNGLKSPRVSNASNLMFKGVDGAALVALLDSKGIRCSQSSACTSNIPEPSYVLRAMGKSEEDAFSSVRFSFSTLNRSQDVDESVAVITEMVSRLRGVKAGRDSSKGVLADEV